MCCTINVISSIKVLDTPDCGLFPLSMVCSISNRMKIVNQKLFTGIKLSFLFLFCILVLKLAKIK